MRTELKISHASSMDNGILFYSTLHKGYVAVAVIDKHGVITTEWTTIKEYKNHKSKQEHENEKKKLLKFILCASPFIIIYYILTVWMMMKGFIYGIRTFFICISFLSLSTLIITTSIEKSQSISLFRFHSAEHMVVNAYKKLKRVPTLEEIRQYSRFHRSCGTNATAVIAISSILMFACSFIPNVLFKIISMLLVNVIVIILLKCGFLSFLQIFTTVTPTETELLVAIAGMNTWLENEKIENEN